MSSNSEETTKSSDSTTTTTKKEEGGGNSNNKSSDTILDVQLPVSVIQISNSPLEYAYSFWFSKRPNKGQPDKGGGGPPGGPSGGVQAYDANLRLVGTFNTVEKFWYLYSHMSRPQDLQGHADIHMFKAGIRPLWEDDTNKNGGKWIVRLKKGLSSR